MLELDGRGVWYGRNVCRVQLTAIIMPSATRTTSGRGAFMRASTSPAMRATPAPSSSATPSHPPPSSPPPPRAASTSLHSLATSARGSAEQAGVSPEEYLRRRVEQMLQQPDEAFREAADHVLRKNAELYRRLA